MNVHLIFSWYDRVTREFVHESWTGPIPREGESVTLGDNRSQGVNLVSYAYTPGELPTVTVQLSDRLKP